MSSLLAHTEIDGTKFKLPITFEDRSGSGGEFSEICVVDTGCPDAIALPAQYGDRLDIFRGKVPRGGAATSGLSSVYSINITSIDGKDISHQLSAVCSLPRGYVHSLIGIDLLKDSLSCIHNSRDQKEMDIEFSFG